MMIDPTTFTQEQQWGLAFVTQQRNAEDPDNPITPEQYAESVLREACGSYWKQLVAYKEKVTIQRFQLAPPKVQEQVFQALGVGNIVE